MHKLLLNEALLTVSLSPGTSFLVKAGRAIELDPTLPDMSFVRTRRADTGEEVPYVPGSSLRGVLRSHAERLVRTLRPDAACEITKRSCVQGQDLDKWSGPEAYRRSCYCCRLFGNTALAARVRISDFYPGGPYLTETRYGVAIDRVTGAVAHGPFQMETVTRGDFKGTLVVRNFTLGQLGLLGAALLDLADQWVFMGHAKSRGLGRVRLHFHSLRIRYLQRYEGTVGPCLFGVEALLGDDDRQAYGLSGPQTQSIPVPNAQTYRSGGFYVLEVNDGAEIRRLLEEAIGLWPPEVEGASQ